MQGSVSMLGDSAWLVQWPETVKLDGRIGEVHTLLHALGADPQKPHGVIDILAAFESLAVRYDPEHADGYGIHAWIESWLARPELAECAPGKLHEIPVCYGGEYGADLNAVARACGVSTEQVIAVHSEAEYSVAMMGFAPGFPYLTGLDERLQVPRLATPRIRVHAGSVAIAGEQAGIYPCDSPGGWHVLGQTNVQLFDPHRLPSPSLLIAGDRVKFVPCSGLGPQICRGEPSTSHGDLEVIEPGIATTVQAAGRPGFESIGVSPGGAVDLEALRVANFLLGNSENAAALEVCVKGPTLRFHRDSRLVLVGANSSGGQHHGRMQAVAAGEVIDTGSLIGSLRAVIAVAGGIDVPEILGSQSTDLRAGFGGFFGRALRAGDRLRMGEASLAMPAVHGVNLACPVGRELSIRCVEGPQASWFGPGALDAFENGFYEVTTRQNRMGMRLQGERLEPAIHREMRSQPVCSGSIQIPPDGRPMILLAERQTHGGYPQIGCVITADLPKLARALPGTRIHFRRVTLEDAWQALMESRQDLQWLQAGLMLAKS